MGEAIIVGIAEIKCTREPNDVLVAPSLGSGICVCAYDSQERVAAMAHVVLPDCHGDHSTAAKFADTAIPCLLQSIIDLGAAPDRVRVALVGGAELRGFRGTGVRLEIGARNAIAVRIGLERANLRVVSADIGGTAGRTVHLTADGRVRVKVAGGRERELVHLGQSIAVPSSPA